MMDPSQKVGLVLGCYETLESGFDCDTIWIVAARVDPTNKELLTPINRRDGVCPVCGAYEYGRYVRPLRRGIINPGYEQLIFPGKVMRLSLEGELSRFFRRLIKRPSKLELTLQLF